MKGDRYLKLLQIASPQTPDLKEIPELPGASAPEPHHLARVLDRGMKANTVKNDYTRHLLRL